MSVTVRSAVFWAALAAGGLVLVVLIAISLMDRREEPLLLADGMPGHQLEVQEGADEVVVWVSSSDGSDPTPEEGAQAMCTLSGTGTLEETDTEQSVIGETTLYPVARITDLDPPVQVACEGSGVQHVYVGSL